MSYHDAICKFRSRSPDFQVDAINRCTEWACTRCEVDAVLMWCRCLLLFVLVLVCALSAVHFQTIDFQSGTTVSCYQPRAKHPHDLQVVASLMPEQVYDE